MFPPILIRYRRPLVLGAHALLVLAAYHAAFWLRFEGAPPSDVPAVLWATVPVLIFIRLIVFAAFGLHRGFWRHFGQRDLINLTEAVGVGTIIFAGVLLLARILGPVPRAVVLLEGMITLLFAGGVRFAVRCVLEGRLSPKGNRQEKRVLVVGAGAAAERLIRQLDHDHDRSLRVVALLDDDPDKQHMALHGVRVVGPIDDLEAVVVRERVQLVVIAITRATPPELRRIVDRCLRAKIECKRLRPKHEMLAGSAKGGGGDFADIELDQLLVRDPVVFDSRSVEEDLGGSVVLITGGAGSVGSELARQIARVHPARLILVEQAESPLYFTHLDLQRSFPTVETVPVIADITDHAAMTRIFERYHPDHVYHAAAYKHVPMMEANAAEAVRNNVLGTMYVAECAACVGARKFVLISTDKAVRPSSIMGATKRVAERIVLGWPALRASDTEFRAVRFGNVLGSEGSVVPLFRRQLAAGGPLTVTHPDVRRYFMTLPEAAQLVLQAATIENAARRITMLDMGEPIRILELAEHLVRLSGLEPYRDVQIVFTGLRPGEKLHEELMSAAEQTVSSGVEKISIVQTDEVDGHAVEEGVKRLLLASARDDRSALLAALRELVPECVAPLRAPAQVPATPSKPLAPEWTSGGGTRSVWSRP
jgi:FlaA1/EpsC-like NDP-sugar epimerase